MAHSVTFTASIQREPLQEQSAKPDIDKLTQIFHIQHAASALEKTKACFEAVLQDCLDKRWFRIHQARDALFDLRDERGETLWHFLLPRVGEGHLESLLDLKLVQVLASQEDLSQLLPCPGKPRFEMSLFTAGLESFCAPLNKKERLLKAMELMQMHENILPQPEMLRNPDCPLVWSVALNDPEAFDRLAAKSEAWLDEISNVGNFLHIAIHYGNIIILEHLLKHYRSYMCHLMEMRNQQGNTPLILATHLQSSQAIVLLTKYGATLNGTDRAGMTPLHHAALLGDEEKIELLIDLGADYTAVNALNQEPLFVAKNETVRTFLATQVSKKIRDESLAEECYQAFVFFGRAPIPNQWIESWLVFEQRLGEREVQKSSKNILRFWRKNEYFNELVREIRSITQDHVEISLQKAIAFLLSIKKSSKAEIWSSHAQAILENPHIDSIINLESHPALKEAFLQLKGSL